MCQLQKKDPIKYYAQGLPLFLLKHLKELGLKLWGHFSQNHIFGDRTVWSLWHELVICLKILDLKYTNENENHHLSKKDVWTSPWPFQNKKNANMKLREKETSFVATFLRGYYIPFFWLVYISLWSKDSLWLILIASLFSLDKLS